MRRILAIAGATLCLALLAGVLAGVLVLQAGWYEVSAVRPHYQFVHTLLERGMQQSVRFHARDIVAPPSSPRTVLRGAVLFRQHCEQCHGGPGVAQGLVGMGMQPVPGPLVDAARRWKPRELFWIAAKGIKMSGMPAWGFHLQEGEIWEIVAFLGELPAMTPVGYRTATAANRGAADSAAGGGTRVAASGGDSDGASASTSGKASAIASGEASASAIASGKASAIASAIASGETSRKANPVASAKRNGLRPADGAAPAADRARGRLALTQYACQSCHMIPGVSGPQTFVGPRLDGLAQRSFIAGKLPRSEANLIRWIRTPQEVKPGSAMPQLGVSERDARDMAAYLLQATY